MKSSSKWTKSYKQKAFSWFCISEKSKFPGKYQEQPYVQPAIFGGGRFLFVPRASTPALIDEVNALPLLIQMGLHIGHKPGDYIMTKINTCKSRSYLKSIIKHWNSTEKKFPIQG